MARRPVQKIKFPLVDINRRTVTLGGIPAYLTAAQFDLVAYLAANPGFVRTRRQILEVISPGATGEYYDRNVDSHVRRSREAFRAAWGIAEWIETAQGVGYRWREVGQ